MILDNIKAFFKKKDAGEKTATAPEGACPNCWGKNEWDNHYFKEIKDRHILPGTKEHDSFVKKIADQVNTTSHKHGTKYICQTCTLEY